MVSLRNASEEMNESSVISEDEEPTGMMHDYHLDLLGGRYRSHSLAIQRAELKEHSGFNEQHNTLDNALLQAFSPHSEKEEEVHKFTDYMKDGGKATRPLSQPAAKSMTMRPRSTTIARRQREFNVLDFFEAVLKIT